MLFRSAEIFFGMHPDVFPVSDEYSGRRYEIFPEEPSERHCEIFPEEPSERYYVAFPDEPSGRHCVIFSGMVL